MKKEKIYVFVIFFVTMIVGSSIFSQVKTPVIGYVYPAGVKVGTELQVVVGGMALNAIRDARFSTKDITVVSAKFFNPFKNFSNDLKNELRPIIKAIETGGDPIEAIKKNTEKQLERLKKQAESKEENSANNDILKIVPGERLIYIDMTPEEVVKYIKEMSPLEYQCLCKEVLTKPNPLQASPAIAQKVLVSLKISPEAKPGRYELRLVCANGVSNPISFEISSYNEISEDYFTIAQKGKKY